MGGDMEEVKVNLSWWDCLVTDTVSVKYQLILTMRMGGGIDEHNRKLPNNGKRKRNWRNVTRPVIIR